MALQCASFSHAIIITFFAQKNDGHLLITTESCFHFFYNTEYHTIVHHRHGILQVGMEGNF